MGILMVHDEHTNASIALSEGIVGGEPTPVRRYRQDGSFLQINPPANAREHDLNELLKLGYRMATTSEQNAYTKQQKQQKTLQEAAKGDK